MLYKKSLASRFFDFCNIAFMILFCISVLYPFWNVLMVSLNDQSAGSLTGLSLLPRKFTLANYIRVLSFPEIWLGYRETIIRTVVGTTLTMLVTAAGAYALAQKSFPHRTFWTVVLIIPMFFSGGLIPGYLNVKELGLIDSRWSLIFPSLVSIYNLTITRNFMMSLPQELRESAWIDGAGEFRTLFQIILPLSVPILATVTLWTLVGNWNAWFDAVIYMNDAHKMPLQVVLRRIVM